MYCMEKGANWKKAEFVHSLIISSKFSFDKLVQFANTHTYKLIKMQNKPFIHSKQIITNSNSTWIRVHDCCYCYYCHRCCCCCCYYRWKLADLRFTTYYFHQKRLSSLMVCVIIIIYLIHRKCRLNVYHMRSNINKEFIETKLNHKMGKYT